MSAGINSSISLGLETTWGTPVVPDKSIGIKQGDGIQTNTDVQTISSIRKLLAANSDAFRGRTSHEGDYEVDFIPGVAGYFLKSLFGSVASVAQSAPNAVVYDHTFTEIEAKPSLTVEQAVDQIVRRYAGTITTGMSLSCAAGETLSATFTNKAKASASATAITPVFETIRPFNFADALSASGITIGGTVYDEVQSFELNYTNNGEMHHVIGSNDPQFFYVKGSEVTGSMEFYMNSDSAAKFTDYLNKTERALDIVFSGDTIGSTAKYGFSVNVPRVVFTAATFPVRDDYNMVSVEFTGLYDNTTSRLIRAVLTNLTASYAA